jgi:hypothetical protein
MAATAALSAAAVEISSPRSNDFLTLRSRDAGGQDRRLIAGLRLGTSRASSELGAEGLHQQART